MGALQRDDESFYSSMKDFTSQGPQTTQPAFSPILEAAPIQTSSWQPVMSGMGPLNLSVGSLSLKTAPPAYEAQPVFPNQAYPGGSLSLPRAYPNMVRARSPEPVFQNPAYGSVVRARSPVLQTSFSPPVPQTSFSPPVPQNREMQGFKGGSIQVTSASRMEGYSTSNITPAYTSYSPPVPQMPFRPSPGLFQAQPQVSRPIGMFGFSGLQVAPATATLSTSTHGMMPAVQPAPSVSSIFASGAVPLSSGKSTRMVSRPQISYI